MLFGLIVVNLGLFAFVDFNVSFHVVPMLVGFALVVRLVACAIQVCLMLVSIYCFVFVYFGENLACVCVILFMFDVVLVVHLW